MTSNVSAAVTPTLKHKPDFVEAARRWDALWQHELLDRPCTVLVADTSTAPKPNRRVCAADGDFAAFMSSGDGYLDTHAFLGEAMPSFRPGFGPDQVAAFLGAPLVVGAETDDTSWSVKIVKDWAEFLPLSIKEDNSYWQAMRRFHAMAEEHFRGRALIAEIDLHSNADLLEGLRGAQDLLLDMIDCPDLVQQAMDQARAVYRRVSDAFAHFGNKDALGTTSGLTMYHRGRFNRIQSDFIALLGPDLFRQFVLPAIEEEANYLDRSCFHLDGPDALRHLDDILAVGKIDAVEWIPGDGNKRAVHWPEVLHRIQDAGKIVFLHATPDEVRKVHREYRPELMCYNLRAKSVSEGEQLLLWLKNNT